HLTGLRLAAVEGPAELPGLRPADRLHRPPELRGGRLVRRVPDLAGQLAVADRVEPLPGELEVEALHVDRPRLVALDVEPTLDASDQVGGGDAVGRRLERDVGHALDGDVAGRVGVGAAVR